MNRETMIAEIDEELTRLRNVREILAGEAAPRRPQLVKGGAAPAAAPRRRRHMSQEARERIRQAQLKRWAKQKRAA